MESLDQAIIDKIDDHEKEAALKLCMETYQISERKAKRKLNKFILARDKANEDLGFIYKKPKFKIKKGDRLKTFIAILFTFIGMMLLLVVAYFIKHF